MTMAMIGHGEEPVGVDLDALIGAHMCVSAGSGGGKSGAIRKLLESTHGRIQHIILDAEDEFYTLRERFDYVIAGGEGGDAPATLANAATIAKAALTSGFSLIAQINDLGADAGSFVSAFLDELIAAPRDQWRPLLIVIDEAQRFAPTNGNSPASRAIKDLMQRGRKRGFTAIVATTKFSELDPSVRGQCRNWMLGYVSQALDRRTVADQMGFAPSSAEAKGLQNLPSRFFWGYGPAISREPTLFRIDDAETTIVKAGQAHVPTPPAPDALREILAALAQPSVEPEPAEGDQVNPASDQLTAENERLRTLLAQEQQQRSIYKLQRDFLAYRLQDIRGAAFVSAADYDRFGHSSMIANRDVVEGAFGKKISFGWLGLKDVAERTDAGIAPQSPEIDASAQTREGREPGSNPTITKGEDHEIDRSAARAPSVTTEPPAPKRIGMEGKAGGSPIDLPRMTIKLIEALAKFYPRSLSIEHCARVAGVSMSSSAWRSYFRPFRESGLVEQMASGEWRLSALGVANLGVAPAPDGAAALLSFWMNALPPSTGAMLKVLVGADGVWIDREVIAHRAGISPTSSGLNSGLKELRDHGLAERDGKGAHRATGALL